MKLRTQILLFFFLFALVPLLLAVVINLPLVLERMELFYHKAHLQNLRADFRDLDQHLASRDEMVRLLAKLPEPGALLGSSNEQPSSSMDIARAQYTHWINQILQDQLDIVQIVFYDRNQLERFWLDRDPLSQRWQPTVQRPSRPPEDFLHTGLAAEAGQVLISKISLDPVAGAQDPRRFMNLRLISPIQQSEGNNLGGVMITIDVGGMARYYRNTFWVHDNGVFLEQAGNNAPQGDAFSRYPGLAEIFKQGKPALWEGSGEQFMWLPLFQTEKAGALWVGRQVDRSPIAAFRNALTFRVLSIIFALVVAIWFIARLIAKRADRLSHDLTDGIQQVLETEQPVQFNWKGPQELKRLGENLTRLSKQHGQNTHNLRAHAKELEESNRYKSQFLANVSHELRTPLNSILLLSKMLADRNSGLEAEQARQAQVIHEAASDLRSLIDNILDLSRIEARRANFTIEHIDLPAMLAELQEIMQPQFDAKGLTLTLTINPDTPRQVVSDVDKIRQIIKNFLANAVKFTETGDIELSLGPIENTPPCRCDLAIRVKDSGIGIPTDKQHHIFEAFKQADGATTRKYGGTGLGLTISQQLAQILGGAIELASTPGEGSTFSLLLPLNFDGENIDADQIHIETADPEEHAIEPDTAPQVDFSGQHILLVDSNMKNLLQLTPLLEGWGARVSAADDAEEALELITEEIDTPIVLVLVNTEMPDQGGYDTISDIKAQHREMTVIAMVSRAREKDGEKPAPTDADDLLGLPVNSELLADVLNRHLPQQVSAPIDDEAI
ncbi:MAG: ATP-binding protein [Chromatiales bacterium]|nr:ATP-binding protein [Chromatiales bacterium]